MSTITAPQNSAELAEALAGTNGDAAEMAKITDAYVKAQASNDDLAQQLSDKVQAGMTEFLRSQGFGANGRPSLGGSGDVHAKQLDGVYDSLGEYALDIRAHREGHATSDKFAKALQISNDYSSTNPGSAGFLIPEEMRQTILDHAVEQSVVRGRATVIQMGSLTTSVPYVDVTSHASTLFGGMTFTWTGEGTSPSPTEAKFGRVKLEAHKLMGRAVIPNELWNDASALGTWLQAAVPAGVSYFEDLAFLTGNGVGQPLGVLNAPAQISVTRATANEVNSADVFEMYSRMLPQALRRAIWVVNHTVWPQLFALGVEVGTSGGSVIGIQQVAGEPFQRLLGRPVITSEKVPALGSVGDVNFIDFGSYLLGDRKSLSIDYSEHSQFSTDETELRVIERVDGRPWVQSALTPRNGDSLSPIVSLGSA